MDDGYDSANGQANLQQGQVDGSILFFHTDGTGIRSQASMLFRFLYYRKPQPYETLARYNIIMNQEWQKLLEQQGAVIDTGRVLNFGNETREIESAKQGEVITDLSHLDRLRIAGANAEEFLLNQLSNDIRLLETTGSQLSAYCNPKGRMFALFRIYRQNDDYVLISDHGIGSNLISRLKMFVMRSKVDIVDISEQEILIGASGHDCANSLAQITGLQLPEKVGEVAQDDSITVIRIEDGGRPRFLVSGQLGVVKPVWIGLSSNARPIGSNAWYWQDIQAGLPSIHATTSEEFIPQMLNLDILNAINFKKGCYPGQEIIARMKYLGKLKQRMFLGHVDTGNPKPGDRIFAASFGNQSAGTVVNATRSPGNGIDLLVVAQLKAANGNDLHLDSPDGPSIHLNTLPYSVPLEGETVSQ